MSMNPTLAAMYNTHGAAQALQEEQQKVAHLTLFAKSAAAKGINLNELDQDTTEALYAAFTQKLAEESGEAKEEEKEEGHKEPDGDEGKEGPGDKDGDEGKEEEKKAYAQFLAMQDWREKTAEADFLGRQMAHSFWNEFQEIQKTAAEIPGHVPTKRGVGPELSASKRMLQQGRDAFRKLKGDASASWSAATPKQKALAIGGTALGAGALGALGAAGYAAKKHHDKKNEEGGEKEASAPVTEFDIKAAQYAVKLAEAATWDPEEAAQRLEARLILGAPAMDKTASALGDFNTAIHTRALELLESAGYPVDWSQG